MTNPTPITVEATVNAPIEKVWEYWNEPKHIEQWCSGSPDWQTTNAKNDVRVGGTISSRMEAKDGSAGFDFGGTYTDVQPQKYLAYTLGDGRKVTIRFEEKGSAVHITEAFDPESQNAPEMQQQGWQGILDNFKKYTESQK